MNYYAILKEHSQVIYKLQPKYFQIVIEKLWVMKFQLVEIETYFPMRSFLCKYIKIFNLKKYYKSQTEKYIFYFELGSKTILI